MRRVVWLIVALVLLVLAVGCLPKSPKAGQVLAKQVKARWIGGARDFTFAKADGKEARASDFAGKPLVVNFWAKS